MNFKSNLESKKVTIKVRKEDKNIQHRVVLVFGTIQSGKSNLINVLSKGFFSTELDPCPVGKAVKHCNKFCTKVRSNFITFLDTPGLGETEDNDLVNLATIANVLTSERNFGKPLFVLKYGTAIVNSTHIAAIQSYKRLVPKMFKMGVILVVTAYSVNEVISKFQSQLVNGCSKDWFEDTIKEFCLLVDSKVDLIAGDFRPTNNDDEENLNKNINLLYQLMVGNNDIITGVFDYFLKPNDMKKEDEREIEIHRRILDEYTSKENELSIDQKDISTELNSCKVNNWKNEKKISELQTKLSEMNSMEKLIINQQVFSKPWKLFEPRQTISWSVTTNCRIIDRRREGFCEFIVTREDSYSDEGIMKSGFWRNFYATIKLYGFSHDFYQPEIKMFQTAINELNELKRRNEIQIDNLELIERDSEDRYEKIRVKRELLRNKIKELGGDMISRASLIDRLKERINLQVEIRELSIMLEIMLIEQHRPTNVNVIPNW
jgi:hypothetical protein